MRIILPKKVSSIISVLNQAGFSAHAVGGCVRDLIMGKEPHDWDITTSARPEQVKALFEVTLDTGLKHGTVTVNHEGQWCEITTWRTDLGYINHRHPEQVRFTDSLEADLARRDFTINAMAFHPDEGIIDPFGGMDDIRSRLIRSVGDPMKRFGEDALRMLRAIRFSAQLGFEIESRTYQAIRMLHADIAYISFERIRSELDKIMASAHPERLGLIWDTRLSDHIFPSIPALPEPFLRTCHEPFIPGTPVYFLGSLFYWVFAQDRTEQAARILWRLKYDNRTISDTRNLLLAAELMKAPTPRNIRLACRLYGKKIAEMAAKISAQHGDTANRENCGFDPLLMADPQPLAITGADLIRSGIGEGREIGAILSLLNLCLCENPRLNTRETLLLLSGAFHKKLLENNLLG